MRTHKRLPKLASLAVIMALGACSVDTVTTAAESVDDIAMPAMPSVVAQHAVVAEEIETPSVAAHGTSANVTYPSNATTHQFTYDPTTDASFIFGVHMVSFPRYTICDPKTSGYGPSTWLNSCTKLTSPITITATRWVDANGRPQIDFNTALRFYKNYFGQLPAIYLRDPSAAMSSWGRVDYCVAPGSCVNEASGDAALVTQREPVTGYLFRLIRHFSGYNVWA